MIRADRYGVPHGFILRPSFYHDWVTLGYDAPKIAIDIGGKKHFGSPAKIKRLLLDHGTEEAIEAASQLRSPVVQVMVGGMQYQVGVKALDDLVEGEETPMPIECERLRGQKPPISVCPECSKSIGSGEGETSRPFMRGWVQRTRRAWTAPWKTRPYCAIICPRCKEIIGWESPLTEGTRRDTAGAGPYR